MNDFKFLKVLSGYALDYYIDNLIKDYEILKMEIILDRDIDGALNYIAYELSKINKLIEKINTIDDHFTSDYIIFYLTLQEEYPDQYQTIRNIIIECINLIDSDIKKIIPAYICNKK